MVNSHIYFLWENEIKNVYAAEKNYAIGIGYSFKQGGMWLKKEKISTWAKYILNF